MQQLMYVFFGLMTCTQKFWQPVYPTQYPCQLSLHRTTHFGYKFVLSGIPIKFLVMLVINFLVDNLHLVDELI